MVANCRTCVDLGFLYRISPKIELYLIFKRRLTFWRRNYFFFNFGTFCILNVNNTGTKYVRFMKQTTF